MAEAQGNHRRTGRAALSAVLLVEGVSLEILSATPGRVELRAMDGLPPTPFVARALISSAEGAVSIPLSVEAVAPGIRPGDWVADVTAPDPVLWDNALAAAERGSALDPRIALALTEQQAGLARADGANQRRRTFAAIAASLVLSAGIIGLQLYRSGYSAAAAISFVSIDFDRLSAPATGRIVFLPGRSHVAAGEPVIGVTQRSGHDISIESPCDCTVVGVSAPVGATVALGDPVVLLAKREAKAFVVAGVNRDLLFKLGRGATVRLTYGDGVVVRRELGPIRLVGQLEALIASVSAPPVREEEATEPPPTNPDLVYIRLDAGRDLTGRSIATPVAVSFDLFWNSGLGAVAAGQDGEANHAG